MAMTGGVNRMPAPMTLETMMAAPSKGPRRRSSVWDPGAVVVVTRGFYPLLSQKLPLDRVLGHLHPRAGAVLAVDLHPRVHKLLVLEHLQPRLGAGVAARRAEDERVARGAGGKAVAVDGVDEVLAPRLALADTPEHGIELDAGDVFRRYVLELEGR